jgi:3-methyladenine DNA glycosylase Tag
LSAAPALSTYKDQQAFSPMTFVLLTSGIGWIIMLTKMHGFIQRAPFEGKIT